MSRGHAARGGLDGYYAPLLNDWGIKEAVPAPLGPMQLLVVDSSKKVPLILGWFLSPAHLIILAVCYAVGCSSPESFHRTLQSIDRECRAAGPITVTSCSRWRVQVRMSFRIAATA